MSVAANSVWPPDYRTELVARVKLIQACAADAYLQQALLLHYAQNPVDWINDWVMTYNPRVAAPLPKAMPFVLFSRQVALIDFLQSCVTDKECGLIEKSRDIGATWICCAYSVWLWLFTPGASVGWGSRKELLVDRLGDPDSIFEKMRMILDTLPVWMLPAGFNMRRHATFMKIINPANGATITGEAGNSIGRGGRSLVYFKDESAHYERPELIEAALGDNTDVQIDISSVHGTNTVFYRRRMAGEVWHPGQQPTPGRARVFIFDWRDHPGKKQEWYERRRAKAAAEGLLHLFAQEVDRDYSAALDRVIIPASWVKAAIDAHLSLGFASDGARIAALDVADEGGDQNAIAIRHGVVVCHIDRWGEGDTGETARRAVNTARSHSCNELYYDSIGVGAGVKAETNRLRNDGIIPASLNILPWCASAAPDRPEERLIAGDLDSPKIGDFFTNLKAQAWWSIRGRFEKTYRAVTQGVKIDPAELISLPAELPFLHEIELELSQATQAVNGKGKMVVDKKPDGGRSPNIADALVMCFSPVRDWSDGRGLLEYMRLEAEHIGAERAEEPV